MSNLNADSAFAYVIHAELNPDGSYRVFLYDMDDEYVEVYEAKRAKITIETLDAEEPESDVALLYLKGANG